MLVVSYPVVFIIHRVHVLPCLLPDNYRASLCLDLSSSPYCIGGSGRYSISEENISEDA